MSSFREKDLFGSGPHRFVAHGRTLRHAIHEPPGGDGVQIAAQGRGGRHIEQAGTLVADNVAGLQNQIDAIEATMDGVAGDLIDEQGRTFAGVLMLSFDCGRVRATGRRLAVDYTASYLQSQP